MEASSWTLKDGLRLLYHTLSKVEVHLTSGDSTAGSPLADFHPNVSSESRELFPKAA